MMIHVVDARCRALMLLANFIFFVGLEPQMSDEMPIVDNNSPNSEERGIYTNPS